MDLKPKLELMAEHYDGKDPVVSELLSDAAYALADKEEKELVDTLRLQFLDDLGDLKLSKPDGKAYRIESGGCRVRADTLIGAIDGLMEEIGNGQE